MTVTISGNDLSKMMCEKATSKSVSARLHALAVANADTIFEAAFVEATHPDTHGRKEVTRTHCLGSALYDAEYGMYEPVLITVLEYLRDGTKMYSIEAIDLAKYENSAGQLVAVANGERQTPIAEFVDIIAQTVAEVNGDGDLWGLTPWRFDERQRRPSQVEVVPAGERADGQCRLRFQRQDHERQDRDADGRRDADGDA